MNKHLETFDARLLDALVDGELNERERTELLRRCDRSPASWRQLAQAFLEAQAWRQALTFAERKPGGTPRSLPMPAQRARSRARTFAWISAWAVSALLAFSLGLTERGGRWESRQNELVAAGSAPAIAAAHPAAADQQTAMGQTLTPAVRQQLERLGYRIQERPRVVSVKRSDGLTVQVLVNEVELRYVGRPFSL
jgi:anti-sigma factor RsiW